MKQTFEAAADATLDKVRATYGKRGEAYADSWATENVVDTFTREAFLLLKDLHPPAITKEHIRLLQAAVLIDIKDSRLCGGYSEDSLIDGIAYRALYARLRKRYDNDESGERFVTKIGHECEAEARCCR